MVCECDDGLHGAGRQKLALALAEAVAEHKCEYNEDGWHVYECEPERRSECGVKVG